MPDRRFSHRLGAQPVDDTDQRIPVRQSAADRLRIERQLLVGTGAARNDPAGEIEFALQVWAAELDLRPALTDAYRALRALSSDAPPEDVAGALQGFSAHPRTAECCGRLLRVLDELGLVRFTPETGSCRVLDGVRTKSEADGVGEEEFNPWILGATL